MKAFVVSSFLALSRRTSQGRACEEKREDSEMLSRQSESHSEIDAYSGSDYLENSKVELDGLLNVS